MGGRVERIINGTVTNRVIGVGGADDFVSQSGDQRVTVRGKQDAAEVWSSGILTPINLGDEPVFVLFEDNDQLKITATPDQTAE